MTDDNGAFQKRIEDSEFGNRDGLVSGCGSARRRSGTSTASRGALAADQEVTVRLFLGVVFGCLILVTEYVSYDRDTVRRHSRLVAVCRDE